MTCFCDDNPVIKSCPPYANADDVTELLNKVCATCTATVASGTDSSLFCAEFGGAKDECCDYLVVFEGNNIWFSTDCSSWLAVSDGSAFGSVSADNVDIKTLSNDIAVVGVCNFAHDGVIINKETTTNLQLSTASDWLGGVSNEAASSFVTFYSDPSGNIKLHNLFPNYPISKTTSRVATMRINQVGWIGTTGFGLGSTSIVYDNEVGDANIAVGMLLGVYTDSGYTQGRGKGSAALGDESDMTFVEVTAIDTGTNTITVRSNNIAFNDNDYLIVIESGTPLYRYESSVWWRYLGALFNDASSNLVGQNNQYGLNMKDNFATITTNTNGTSDTTSTSYVPIDSSIFRHKIVTTGNLIQLYFTGMFSTAGLYPYINIYLDEDEILDSQAIVNINIGSGFSNTSFTWNTLGIPPGTHTFELYWKIDSSSVSLYLGDTGFGSHPQFSVKEVKYD